MKRSDRLIASFVRYRQPPRPVWVTAGSVSGRRLSTTWSQEIADSRASRSTSGLTLRRIAEADALGSTTLTFRLVVLTACRSHRVRLARCREFDLKHAVPDHPEKRRKAGRVHRVPLSRGERTSPRG